MTPMNATPPTWLDIDEATYKRLLNRTAVTLTKRARKQGGTYQVKEAIDAIHAAFHRCDGTDPYDGLPLEGPLLKTNPSAGARPGNSAEINHDSRCPTVCPAKNNTIANFEILSIQTQQSKGTMKAEEFINHCRAVVAHADKASITKR